MVDVLQTKANQTDSACLVLWHVNPCWFIQFQSHFFPQAVICFFVSIKLATVVEGDQEAPFSIATTQRCRGGRYSFIWIPPLLPLIRTLYC